MFQYAQDALNKAFDKLEPKKTEKARKLFLEAKEKIISNLVYSKEYEDLKRRYPGYASFLSKGAKPNGLHDELCV